MKQKIYGLGVVLALALVWLVCQEPASKQGIQQQIRQIHLRPASTKILKTLQVYDKLRALSQERDSCRALELLQEIDTELNQLQNEKTD